MKGVCVCSQFLYRIYTRGAKRGPTPIYEKSLLRHKVVFYCKYKHYVYELPC